ncbi:protein Wiz-like isoform X1 [Arapaima gigas]
MAEQTGLPHAPPSRPGDVTQPWPVQPAEERDGWLQGLVSCRPPASQPAGRPCPKGTMEPAGHSPSSTNSPSEAGNLLSASTPLNSTLQTSYSSVVREEDTGSGSPRDLCGEEKEVTVLGTGAGDVAQRSPRPSAFPSSQAWDSDSEKETLDEEELQHFSNPHGLAAHSPGPPLRSPSTGHRQERSETEVDQARVKVQHLLTEDDKSSPVGGWDQGGGSTHHDEPKMLQIGSPDSEGDCHRERASKVSAEALLSQNKPKEGRRKGVGAKEKPKRKEEGLWLDVYSFPGDSDPDSPPLAPWAHCTFTQRRRRKRALLRPFSGLGSQQHSALGPGKRHNHKEELGAELRRGALKVEEEQKDDAVEVVEKKVEGVDTLCQEVFTCVECSIYFKKQVHLQEHMQQHFQSKGVKQQREKGARGAEGEDRGFVCAECGWELEDSSSLAEHLRQHQESRQKILSEISKLDEDSRGAGAHVGLHGVRIRGSSFGGSPHSSCGPKDLSSLLSHDASGFQETCQAHPIQPAVWDEGQQEEHCPGTSQDLFKVAHPKEGSSHQPLPQATVTSVVARANTKAGASPRGGPHPPTALPATSAGPCRRDVAFKSLSNRRRGRKGVDLAILSTSSVGCEVLPLESGEIQKQDKILALREKAVHRRISSHRGTWGHISTAWFTDSVEVPVSAIRLKRTFAASLRGAAEALGLTETQQVQLRHMVPLVLIEPIYFGPKTRSSRPSCAERDEATGKSPSADYTFIHSPKSKDSEGEEDDECRDDDEENIFLSSEALEEDAGILKNIERKCPYCPDRFHNGIGLANHIRGHLNRVGVSYNVRHFISPEEVNAIERRFSYQKKRKKVANFDPDTFSLMRCEFCSAGFDTRAGLSSHARAHLRDFGITNWEVTVSPINILRELFSSRPDLALPTGPPISSPVDGPDVEDEWEVAGTSGLGPVEVASPSCSLSPPTPPTPPPVAAHAEEEDLEAEMEDASPRPGGSSVVPADSGPADSPSHESADSKAPSLLKCEVCEAPFETRRGLSSHARSHLRQLGISVSESSGAPIDLLYQLIKEKDGHFSPAQYQSPAAKKTQHGASAARKEVAGAGVKVGVVENKPAPPLSPVGSASKAAPSTSRSSSPSLFVKSRSASPSLKKAPVSTLLQTSSLCTMDSKLGSGKSLSASLASAAASKPFWAPHETDAPLNLSEVDACREIVCQLCGAWFETRKGLSSHARAHLRHFGVVDVETKGSPIDLLNQLINTDDFKHRSSTMLPELSEEGSIRASLSSISPLSSGKRPVLPSPPTGLHKGASAGGCGSGMKSAARSVPLSPPVKRFKPSATEKAAMQAFHMSSGELVPLTHGEPLKEIACEFCGEYFENRKGLSSHARSHLRQLGITEWSVNGSPIDTLRELITRRGLPCALPIQSLKSPPPSPRSPRSPPISPSSPGLTKHLPGPLSHGHQPTARKGGTILGSSLPLKPKVEPVQLELVPPNADMGGAKTGGRATIGPAGSCVPDGLPQNWNARDSVLPLNFATTAEPEPTRDIRCEFCGEYFENRKGLSSHARSHLRQLGITEWSVNGSPIDTLRELMLKKGTSPAGHMKKEPGISGGGAAWDGLGYLSPKFSRKSPLSMVHTGSRLHKQGMGRLSLHSPPLNGKGGGFVSVCALGKRALPEEGLLEKTSPKAFSPPPLDFSFKRKSSPEKYAASHSAPASDASCELCGFYFENRKALASHARAHLRQFGVTEWCVNGSPIETLSAWIRSRPQKVAEIHRRYLQGDRPFPKKKYGLSSLASNFRDGTASGAHRSPSSQRPSLGSPLGRRAGREVTGGGWVSSRPGHGGTSLPQTLHSLSGQTLPHAQVARSELNVRTPRGFERRPPKHLTHSENGERDRTPPQPPRTGTIPALVPKPPTTPLVKLVGKIYSLKCRFCEVEFHGPLSIQEDWVRHLQQHILDLNFNKADLPSTPASASAPATVPATVSPPASTQENIPAATATAVTSVPTSTPTATPTPTPSPSPALTTTPTPASPCRPPSAPETSP